MPRKALTNPLIEVEKIGLTLLLPIKFTANRYYVTIPKEMLTQYGLMVGDQLKTQILEARKKRDVDPLVLEEELKQQLKDLQEKRKKDKAGISF